MKTCMLCEKPEHVGRCAGADYKKTQAKRVSGRKTEGRTVNVIEDASRAGTSELGTDGTIDVFVANLYAEEQKTGGSVDYYKCHVADPIDPTSKPYTAESIDIIEALGMTFAEGEAFKAIWRTCTGRMGGAVKADNKALYNAEKVEFFGARMVRAAKRSEAE